MSLRGYQRPVLVGIHRGMVRERGGTYTVMFPRQSGKNQVAAFLVGGLLAAHSRTGGSVVVCAPTYTPQALISFHRSLDLFRRMVSLSGRFAVERNTIRFGNARAHYLGANPEANVAGHTASLAIIADEAQDIDGDWFDRQFRPMAASTGAPTVMFGTPWNGQSLLERAVARNEQIQRSRNYRVSWRDVAAELAEYGEYVRVERARLGAGHHLFRTQYELLAGQPHDSLLSLEQLGNLRGAHPRLRGPVAGERYVGGLDIGGPGPNADATVLTIGRVVGRRLEVVEHRAWQSAGFGELAREVGAAQRHWRMATVLVDATGIGAGLPDLLEEQQVPVEAFKFTAGSKSELGNLLIAAVETGGLALYADDGSDEYARCLQELRDCHAVREPGGRFNWGNDRGHDDYVASLALCLKAGRALEPVRIAQGRMRAS